MYKCIWCNKDVSTPGYCSEWCEFSGDAYGFALAAIQRYENGERWNIERPLYE